MAEAETHWVESLGFLKDGEFFLKKPLPGGGFIFFHPCLGKIPILTSILFKGVETSN